TPQELHIPVTVTATAPAANSHTVSMTTGGRTRASLDVLTGTTVLTIGTANFGPGGSLLTVTTPAGTPVPQLSWSNPDGTGNGTPPPPPGPPPPHTPPSAGRPPGRGAPAGPTSTCPAASCPASPSTPAR